MLNELKSTNCSHTILNVGFLCHLYTFVLLYSTRVSNELGAGRPQAARLATHVVMMVALVVGILIGLVMILVRNVWGHAYSSEKEVVEYIFRMMPILAVSFVFDDMQCVLSGKYI
jgi:multidrug resistance protein, MATE family